MMQKPPAPDMNLDLLTMMPLTARRVLIVGDDTDGLAAAFLLRNPQAQIDRAEGAAGYDLIALTGDLTRDDLAGFLRRLAGLMVPGVFWFWRRATRRIGPFCAICWAMARGRRASLR